MASVYTVEFENQSITNANGDVDFFELRPGTGNQAITLIGYELYSTSIVQDTDEEQIRCRIISMIGGTFTTGTGGGTPTPNPVDLLVADAADFAADTVNTGVATTTGTTRNHGSFAFNGRVGTGIVWIPPEGRVTVPGVANVGLLIRLVAAIATTEEFSGTCWVKEGI